VCCAPSGGAVGRETAQDEQAPAAGPPAPDALRAGASSRGARTQRAAGPRGRAGQARAGDWDARS